ncbi:MULTISPECIES: hypothetical protein [unclassified Nocardioides]|nr:MULTISPECIES: hypothetical protein [unclassified Nocardioides]
MKHITIPMMQFRSSVDSGAGTSEGDPDDARYSLAEPISVQRRKLSPT